MCIRDSYITDRFLPDKAIDLIDEACAMIRTEMGSMPTEMDVVDRKIIQLEMEEAALKDEEDELSKARLAELRKELAEQRDAFASMKAKWENEKNAIGRDVYKRQLYQQHINIHMISTSEVKISVLIDKDDSDRAVRVLHNQFFQ